MNKIQNNNKTNKTDSKNKKFSYNYINSEKNKIREKNPNIFHFNKESSFIYESRRCIYFYSKLEIAKSGQGKKNLNNLIKQKINILNNNKNKKFIENKSETPSEDSEKDININNNAKLQKIENDYNNIIQKRNKLIKRKKRKINPSKSFYK